MSIESVSLDVVGVVHNERAELADDNWGEIESEIHLNPEVLSPCALHGLEAFSHLEVIYFMHKVPQDQVVTGLRRPRNLHHLPEVGILAQRPKARPNRLGLSRCKLRGIHNLTLHVTGLDAICGSPVIDIKPFYREFGPIEETRQPVWVSEVMKNYYA